ncbi:hypothetical protein H483_0109190 [Dietzia sp. UCD-THP]|nr:hypothetical protein H483_0109190 [Dietzia sp. UCD-THP]
MSRITGQWEEVYRRSAGLVVEPGDGIALAAAARRIARDSEFRTSMAENALRLAESNRWEELAHVLDRGIRSRP